MGQNCMVSSTMYTFSKYYEDVNMEEGESNRHVARKGTWEMHSFWPERLNGKDRLWEAEMREQLACWNIYKRNAMWAGCIWANIVQRQASLYVRMNLQAS
jgi:hypothetical protein